MSRQLSKPLPCAELSTAVAAWPQRRVGPVRTSGCRPALSGGRAGNPLPWQLRAHLPEGSGSAHWATPARAQRPLRMRTLPGSRADVTAWVSERLPTRHGPRTLSPMAAEKAGASWRPGLRQGRPSDRAAPCRRGRHRPPRPRVPGRTGPCSPPSAVSGGGHASPRGAGAGGRPRWEGAVSSSQQEAGPAAGETASSAHSPAGPSSGCLRLWGRLQVTGGTSRGPSSGPHRIPGAEGGVGTPGL